ADDVRDNSGYVNQHLTTRSNTSGSHICMFIIVIVFGTFEYSEVVRRE
ncbi:unnamed protein product, partial [Allacma fusca]